MASRLEKIADAVRTLGDGSTSHVRDLQRGRSSAGQLAAAVLDPQLPSSGQAAGHLHAARDALNDALAHLGEFQQDANAFAARLVGGSGGGSATVPGALGAAAVAAASMANDAPSGENISGPPSSEGTSGTRPASETRTPLKQEADSRAGVVFDEASLGLDVVDLYKDMMSLATRVDIDTELGLFGVGLEAVGDVATGISVYTSVTDIYEAMEAEDSDAFSSAVISALVDVTQLGIAAGSFGVVAPIIPLALTAASLGIGILELSNGQPFIKTLREFTQVKNNPQQKGRKP